MTRRRLTLGLLAGLALIGPAPGAQDPSPADGEGLLRLTRREVEARMGGAPDRKVKVATQGLVLEQWIYRSQRGHQYINFHQVPGRPQALVASFYFYRRPGPDELGAGDTPP